MAESFGDPNAMYGFAIGQSQFATTYIDALMKATAIIPPDINPVFPDIPTAPKPVETTPPNFEPITFQYPVPPTAFTEQLDITGLLPGPFTQTGPTLNFPTAPVAFADVAPTAPAVNLTFTYPTLNLELPTPPELLKLNTVQFNGITLPTPPGDPMTLDIVAPSVIPYTPGGGYTSTLLTTLKSKLESRLQGNDTGLPANVEQALWDRASEREYRAQADALADLDRMEELGWSLPPGVLLDARLKVQTETDYNRSMLSREIMIKQAELHLENINKATDSAIALEGKLIDALNAYEQRQLEAAKYATEAGIAVYNAKVQAYSAYLDAYKTKVAVYEAEIRAQVALVDVYKAQVDAEKAKADMNVAVISGYKAQIDAALSAVEIYKAELGAIQTKAEIERTKVQVFGEQIRAYVSRINAYTAQVEGYKAAVMAEGSKQDAFKSVVQAYSAQVDAGAKAAEARIRRYEGLLRGKQVEWDAYKAILAGEQAKAQVVSEINKTKAETYKATVSAISAYNELVTKQWEAATNIAEKAAEVAINAQKMNAELYITTRQLAGEGAKIGAQVSAQLGAAALNAIHWSSSLNTGYSEGISTSTSISTSTNTNYNYNV